MKADDNDLYRVITRCLIALMVRLVSDLMLQYGILLSRHSQHLLGRPWRNPSISRRPHGSRVSRLSHHPCQREDEKSVLIIYSFPTRRAAVAHWRTTNSVQWSEIEHTPEGKRRASLEDSDPAYAIPLKQYIINVLTQAQNVGLGPYWEKADEGTKRSLEKFLA